MFFTRTIIISMMLLIVSACSGDKSVKVSSLQKKDKRLSCKEVMLEQNEAEFYRKTAEKNKDPKFKNLIMPLGYISTYVDAEEAINAADARIDYLNRIYDILGCDDRGRARVAMNTGSYQKPVTHMPPHAVGYYEPSDTQVPHYYHTDPVQSGGSEHSLNDWY